MIRLSLAALAAALAAPGGDPEPPRLLSAWGLFEGKLSEQRPAAGVLPFEVNTPLFSDYAEKHRLIRLPPGTRMGYRAEGAFDFPVGAVLVKTFSYPGRVLETRLLVRRPAGWIGLPYVWNEERTDALLRPAGTALDGVSFTDPRGAARSLRYLVPNRNQCKACHEAEGRGRMAPLGATAANLNRSGQLERWSAAGKLRGAPKSAPKLPAWDEPRGAPVAERARAYLAVNCAHCHNPSGPASTAGLDLRFSQQDPLKLGVGKPPVAAGRGTGGRAFGIVPGRPDESILVHRLESVEPGVAMPELGRRLAHAEGVELVRRWVEGMLKP